MNIITGARGFPEQACLRALDGEIFKFHGESWDAIELYAAVIEIDRRLTTACAQRVSTMKCIPSMTKDTDRAFWVSRDVFEREFDQQDFCCRDSQKIDRNYSEHWFHTDSKGRLCFALPTVQIAASGATQFINGRHRTAVLFREIDRIPVAFTAGPAQEMAERLGLKQVSVGESIELPDLPIVDRPEP